MVQPDLEQLEMMKLLREMPCMGRVVHPEQGPAKEKPTHHHQAHCQAVAPNRMMKDWHKVCRD